MDRDSKKLAEDPSTKELNQFVQNMLKQMQERFDEMSSNIIGRVDEMGNSCVMQAKESMTSKSPLAR
jgi:heat shock factor-binding protein 1